MIAYTEEEIYDLLDAVNCIEDCRELLSYVCSHIEMYSLECLVHTIGTTSLFIDINDKNFNP